MISEKSVLDALRHVDDPDLKKDLVTLGMIENLHVQGNKVQFTVVLTTPACPMKDMIRNACINAVKHLVSQEAEVEVTMSSRTQSGRGNAGFLGGVKNIIGIASGKGGVGKSSVAVNVAMALRQMGASVGLLDADIHGPSVPGLLGIQSDSVEFFEQGDKKIMVPVEAYGMKVLSIGLLTDPDQPVVWRGPMISSALRQLIQDADWGNLDYLVVDLPPGTGDIHITLSQNFPVSGVILVTTPQKIAVDDTVKAAAMFKMPGVQVPILGIVENMAWFSPPELPDNKYYIFGQGGADLLGHKFNIPVIGRIPISLDITDANNQGKPEALNVASPFIDLAGKIVQRIAVVNNEYSETAQA